MPWPISSDYTLTVNSIVLLLQGMRAGWGPGMISDATIRKAIVGGYALPILGESIIHPATMFCNLMKASSCVWSLVVVIAGFL